jgi:hypothetical protein
LLRSAREPKPTETGTSLTPLQKFAAKLGQLQQLQQLLQLSLQFRQLLQLQKLLQKPRAVLVLWNGSTALLGAEEELGYSTLRC